MSSLLSETLNKWLEDKAQRLGAALAYYAAFSIAPLLIFLIAVAGIFFEDQSMELVQAQLEQVLGESAAGAITALIQNVNSNPTSGIVATSLAVLTLILGATGVFGQLQDAMNTIWEVTPKPRRLWADVLRTRILSFTLILAICILLLASVVASAALAWASGYVQDLLPFTAGLWPVVDLAFSIAVTTVLFALIFKIMPDVHVAWNDVWLGAAATAVLFATGKIAIAFYLGRSSFTSVYGAAGSLLVLLAWVYYSAQILFFGAEFTWVYAHRKGRRFRPARGAHFLSEAQRIHEGIPHTETVQTAFKNRKVA